ncbi:hypothetical protein [uncultured Veillonella sp.]|uniref:hypothetical protein n=1 Tax=uncultured Veillonella sp. TaxID=159268 RepID=UPI0025EE1F13|nr:hypothetical protein [uncultured Veillonella sp.]
MEQLFYLLIPLGLCLFYLGIKYTIRFGSAKMLYEMPYTNKEGTFTLERSGTYGLWLSGKMFTKAPIGEFGFNLVDEKTGRTIPLFLSIMRARVNGITHSRMELYTFDAGPGTYRLSVTEDPFVLDVVMKKVGDKVIKDAIDYNQFTIQIYTHTSFVLRFISIWMIALGLIIAVLGGVLPNI